MGGEDVVHTHNRMFLCHKKNELMPLASLVAQKKIRPQHGRTGFDPWVGKIPWRRARLPTPVFWPGEFHRTYSSWGCKESDTTEWLFYFTLMPLAATWMDPEMIILSEVSETEKGQYHMISLLWGFPGGTSGKEHTCQCTKHERCGFDPWVGKIPWRRPWQPTPVVLPGKFHGQRSLVGYSPWGRKESDRTGLST